MTIPRRIYRAPTPFGPVELMSREGKQIDVLLFYINGDIAHGLYRVGVKEHTFFVANLTDFGNGLDGSDFIVGVHDGDKGGIFPDRGGYILHPDKSLWGDWKLGDFKSLFAQGIHRVKDCVMLEHRGDKMLFSLFWPWCGPRP